MKKHGHDNNGRAFLVLGLLKIEKIVLQSYQVHIFTVTLHIVVQRCSVREI